MRVYLDVSCLNRMYDDQSQLRIRLEADAVAHILERVDRGLDLHVSSKMALIEIDANLDAERRQRVRSLLPDARRTIPLDETMFTRAAALGQLGFKYADALHIAAAERLGADALLTCDDRLMRTARRHRSELRVHVTSPLVWMEECDEAANT